MKICSQCGFENPEDIHICLRCAATLERICSNCGAIIPLENNFCGKCGAKAEDTAKDSAVRESTMRIDMHERLLKSLRSQMPPNLMDKMAKASAEILGQRREVTSMCVDIASADKAVVTIGSEDLYLAIDELIREMSDSIYRYEGIIDQFTGRGLIAIFGIPLNHENDPERAIRAALEIVNEIEKNQKSIQQKYHFEFPIKIGINTGSVIIGSQLNQNQLEYAIVGDTISLAQDLQMAAKDNQILTSFSTYQRTAPIFEFQVIPGKQVSGTDQSIKYYRPTQLRYRPGQVRGLPGMKIPMIGREADLEVLNFTYDQLIQTNESQIVLISGDAGLGKSRLIAEFRNNQIKNGVRCFWGTCASYMRITPYRVVGDVLRNYLQISELDNVNTQREALQQTLTRLNLDKHDILPNLLFVLGLLKEDPMLEVRVKLLEPVMLQRQTQLALRTFFTTISRQSPIVLIFDDLHWVDQASQQFLEYFCQAITEESLMLIFAARDFELHEPARMIAAAAHKHTQTPKEIGLNPLSSNDALILVDQFVKEKTNTAACVKETITKRAAGNPFYTEELVRILIDHDGLIYRENEWRLTDRAENLLKEIPGTLQDIILARLDRLPERLRQIAQWASVLGDLFSASLLSSIYKGSFEQLKVSLDELEARDFLVFTRNGNEDIYIFKHPLLQETIYKTLLKRDLRNLHYDIAIAIENGEHWLPGERSQILAWHFGESNTPSKAIPYLLLSAEQAFRHFAHNTVSQLYRQALELINSTTGISSDIVDQVKIGLAQAIKYSGQFSDASRLLQEVIDSRMALSAFGSDQVTDPLLIDSFRELADIRTREGNLDLAVDLLTKGINLLGNVGREKDPVQWRRLADRIAWVYFRQGKLEEAYNLADLALMEVKSWESDDPITLASLYNTLGGIYWTRLRYEEAIDSVERSLAIYQSLDYQWGMAISLTNLGVLNFSIGKWPECISFLEQADQIRSEFGHHPERPTNLINLGEALIAVGNFERARRVLESSLDISSRMGSEIYLAYTQLTLAHLSILESKLPEADKFLEKGWKLLEPHAESSERAVQYYWLKALIFLFQAELSNALEIAERALEIAELGGFVTKKIDVLRTLGVINTHLENFSVAESQFKESLRLGNNPYNEAQGLRELGALYILRAQQTPSEEWAWYKKATSALDRSTSMLETLGARHDLRQTQALRSSIPNPEEVTPIISGGQTSSEELSIIESVRRKLGIPEGEWYQATIMSLSIIPNQNVDEEILFETTSFLLPLLIEIIQENGGKVLRQTSGLTAIFGVPTTYEDDTEKAVETAIEITNFYTELYSQTQLPIVIRIGIADGKIVAGWPNQDRKNEFLAAGLPLQNARALADLTAPSRIWVTQSVRNLTTFRFDFSPVPTEFVHHLNENVIFQLSGERDQVLPVRGLIGLRTVFVGRQAELNAVLDITRSLFSDPPSGGMVWLEGDPGIGKSRLTRELETIVSQLGASIWRGICTARGSDFAFSVFRDLLSDAFDVQPNFAQDQIYQCIQEKLSLWMTEVDELRPFVEMLIGVPPSGITGEQVTSLEPEQLRRQTFVALNRLISKLTEQHPLVVILDDVQWIDSISADLLLYLSPLTFTHPVIIICVQRHNEPSAYEQTLGRVRSLTSQRLLNLDLKPLNNTDCQLLLDHYLAGSKLDDTLRTLIIQQSGGNPYFIEEFLRMLLEQDYLRLDQGKLEINQEWHINNLNIPSSLETLIRARVDALPSSARQILQVASVLGNRFLESLLVTIADRSDVLAILELLQERGMLLQTSEEDVWEFSHQMIEIIVYNTVLKAQRRILHLRVAHVLENLWKGFESEHADELAYHFGKAEEHGKTLDYLILAGERAARRYANDAAIAYFEQASDMLSVVQDVPDLHRWRIIHGLGEVYLLVGNYEAALIALHSGLDLLQNSSLSSTQLASFYRLIGESHFRKGDLDQAISSHHQGLALIGNPDNPASVSEAALIYSRLGWNYFLKSEFEPALESVLKAEELAQEANNPNTLAAAENLLGGINWSRGDMSQAMLHTRQAMMMWQEMGYTWGVAVTLNNLAILEASSGDWNAAAESFRKALALRMEMGDVEGIALAHNNLAVLARDQGKFDEAEEEYRASMTISEPFNMSYHEAVSYNGLAHTFLMEGRIREAIQAARRSDEIATELEAREILVELKRLHALIAQAENQLERAEELSRQAIEAAREINSNIHISSATRALASVLLEQGRAEQALKLLVEEWELQKNGLEELENGRVHAQLAKIYYALGDSEKYLTARDTAQGIFRRLGAEFDISQSQET